MLPSLSDYLSSAARWHDTHRNVRFEVSHHGVSEYSPEGTWCFYIFLHEELFQRPEDWALFNLPEERREWAGKIRSHFPYDSIPELLWHGGITFGERTVCVLPDGRDSFMLKLGCDYGHLWDREAGFPGNLVSVKRDAIRLIDDFATRFPVKTRCAYSGKWDTPENFYTARNGALVHRSTNVSGAHANWQPNEEPSR